jgi:hypothetical protein
LGGGGVFSSFWDQIWALRLLNRVPINNIIIITHTPDPVLGLSGDSDRGDELGDEPPHGESSGSANVGDGVNLFHGAAQVSLSYAAFCKPRRDD